MIQSDLRIFFKGVGKNHHLDQLNPPPLPGAKQYPWEESESIGGQRQKGPHGNRWFLCDLQPKQKEASKKHGEFSLSFFDFEKGVFFSR